MSKDSRVQFGLVVLVLVLVAILVLGCSAPPSPSLGEYYRDTWLFGEHEVRHLERFQGVQGEFQGGFFLASGTIGGSFGTETMIMFSWDREPGERFMTTLPASKFRVLVDEGKTTPTVEFQFYESGSERYNPDCHHRRGEVEEANPNDYLMNPEDGLTCYWACPSRCYFGGLKVVIVRISSDTLEKEIYLPK